MCRRRVNVFAAIKRSRRVGPDIASVTGARIPKHGAALRRLPIMAGLDDAPLSIECPLCGMEVKLTLLLGGFACGGGIAVDDAPDVRFLLDDDVLPLTLISLRSPILTSS